MAIFSKAVTKMQRLMQDNRATDDRGIGISIASRHNHNRVGYMPSPTHPRKQTTLGDLLRIAANKIPTPSKKKITLKPRKETDQ